MKNLSHYEEGFLWIQETPSKTDSKVNSRKVHAHAGKVRARAFRQNHKTATQSRNPALAARIASSDTREQLQRTSTGISLTRYLGAGRVDPFSSYPGQKLKRSAQEALDYCVTFHIPQLLPDDKHKSPSTTSPVARAWIASAFKFPLVFHAIIFASYINQGFQRRPTDYDFLNTPLALTHKILAIQKLNETLANQTQAYSDEVILTIFLLAVHEDFEFSPANKSPFNSPLTDSQFLNLYGAIKFQNIIHHWTAIFGIISSRGGLENIKLPGVAELMSSSEIKLATATLAKPMFPLVKSLEFRISILTTWATSPPRSAILTQATGFRKLKQLNLPDVMLNIFDEMGAFTLAVDHHLRRTLTGLTLPAIIRTRSPIQHRLLSLPSQTELSDSNVNSLSLYECCRLAAQIYSLAVIYPIPNSSPVLQALVTRLKVSLEAFTVEKHNTENTWSDCVLWVLVLGGIAALNKRERVWFVSRLARLAAERSLSSWRSVEDVLEGFLWLDSACSEGGRLLWTEVVLCQ